MRRYMGAGEVPVGLDVRSSSLMLSAGILAKIPLRFLLIFLVFSVLRFAALKP
jgi:hypothetical protein